MDEFSLIQRYFAQDSSMSDGLLLGIGDDAALVSGESSCCWAIAADTLVAGRHFPHDADAALVASRLLRVNLSDMAAMAAQPRFYTLCLTLPEADALWLQAFSDQLRQDSAVYGCRLIGGDTTAGPLTLSLQMLGSVAADNALKRSGAKLGDDIWVTGTLGDAAAFVASGFSKEMSHRALAERFWVPQPRIDFAVAAATFISAAIDISDGLVADLGHICSASDVGALLQAQSIPLSAELQALMAQQSLELALCGGDDYELCFTAAPQNRSALEVVAAALQLRLSRIGEITAKTGVTCVAEDGKPVDTGRGGYRHF